MEILHRMWVDVVHYTQANFQLGGPYGLPSLVGAMIVAWGYFVYRRRSAGRAYDLKTFFSWLFPRKLMRHASTLIDVRLWLINASVMGFAYAWLAISGLWVRNVTVSGLTHALGERAPTAWPWGLVMSLTTVAALLAFELGYWFGHYLFHRYAFLWEFHKVHHSAEVMTIFTELRQHPVEILAFVNLIAISSGVTLGALTYIFGPGAHALHAAQRQHRAAFVPDDLGPPAPFPHLVGVHRRARASVAEPGASSAPPFRPPRPFQQEPRFFPRRVGLAIRHAYDP